MGDIWHCPSKVDRELAEILVECQTAEQWNAIAKHFGKEYPYTLPDKFDLIYRLFGCKK